LPWIYEKKNEKVYEKTLCDIYKGEIFEKRARVWRRLLFGPHIYSEKHSQRITEEKLGTVA
jgi:hypothetical protein